MRREVVLRAVTAPRRRASPGREPLVPRLLRLAQVAASGNRGSAEVVRFMLDVDREVRPSPPTSRPVSGTANKTGFRSAVRQAKPGRRGMCHMN
jgi:hypothetical protein